ESVSERVGASIELRIRPSAVAGLECHAVGHEVDGMLEEVRDGERHASKLERVIVRGKVFVAPGGKMSVESTTDAPECLVEKRGHVLIVTMNRPQARNALSGPMMRIMEQAWDQVDADPDIRVA